MVRKDNFVKSLGFLALIVGIGFFAFENREVFAQKLTQRATTQTALTPKETSLTTPKGLDPIIQPSQLNRQQTQVIQGASRPQAIVQQTPTEIVQEPQAQVSRITKRVTSAETSPLVQKPEFLAPRDIINPKAFNKRKFGIDTDLARSALSKQQSQRTIAERKQIANITAMEVFDSSKISNF